MATAAQVLANRENAQLSTGPLTSEGKQKASQNAAKHHLTGRGIIILPGQETNFHRLESGLRESLIPKGELQETLFIRILESAWTLHRCRLAEEQLYASTSDPTLDPLLDETSAA